MALGDTQNGNVSSLTKDKPLPTTESLQLATATAATTATTTTTTTTQQQQQLQNKEQMEKGSNEKIATPKAAKQTDATISFLRAARSGDLSKVIEFLESGHVTDINTCNANGLNALHLAAKDGYIDIVSELLRRGANVDNATKKGNTALHIASLAGQKDVIKLLIQYNANVNVQSLNGFTPLYMAAQENHDACVRYLLAKGANPSLATEDGFTPLAVAMQQGHDKVVAVLLESDSRGKVRLPALHIAAKKDDVKAATLLLENLHNPDIVSKSGFTPLHIAAHYGNVDIAKLLIDRGADVNYIAKHNITPLHVACKWGKTNILKLLLANNARIDATTRDGLTPLHCAARSGHREVIEILLQNHAPILSKTKNGLAPLHMAAQGEHDEAARLLLMHKAPVDEVTVDYLTALHVSAHCGHVKVAKLLLDYNADPNARALNGFTPLHIACKKNRIKVVELLLKHSASISATTESGLTPLHVASFMGCMNIVIFLLQHDANPDAPTVRGETPLHLAARANQTDIIRILLRNGAQVDVKAREGQTPLHVASRLGNIDIIMLMLQHRANVDATTKDLYTPLHIAAKEGQDEVAQLLIDNHATLDAKTKKDFSPLHLAAKYGKVQVANLLLQKGATIDSQGKNGVTPLHVAAHYDHQNVALLLLDKGASPHTCAKNGHTALHIAAKKNQMEIATNLLQYGAEPNAKSKSGFTPIHLAAQEGHIDMVNLLLENGADSNAAAKNGLTPIHLCAQEDKFGVARILLDHNANISERTKSGYTPLHVAAHFGQINMVKFLLENDANIEMSTNIGYTPLHQAAQQGHTLVINLLLTHRANPNALTNNGQTPLSIANKLGYVTAVETLKIVTEKSITNTVAGVVEEKYKVVAPESMHEAFMSDSEDEGGEDHMDQHQYKYMATDDLKTMINEHDQTNYDTTDDSHLGGDGGGSIGGGSHHRNKPIHEQITNAAYVNQNVSASNPYAIKSIDNVTITRPPIHLGRQKLCNEVDSCSILSDLECCLESFGGRMKTHPMCRESFLVSFLVDARGGAMRGCRHSGVRVIVPPKSCAQPTRITCRYVKPQRVPNPPPLMEGEALVSRIMELSPVEAKFLGPVILEVPHFGSLRDKEREIIILRLDNGETWREHTLFDSEEAVRDVLNETFESTELSHLEDLHTNRIIRIVTRNFPHFFAVVSRIRQEVHAIGPDGGTVSSTAVPQVQAIFPPNALTKKIRVGLQAQPVDLNGCCKLLGQGVAVSPVVTVEPRRRKFHKAITLSIPAPKAYTQGMVNQYSGNAPTLRLLCSITGGQNRAVWEDVTGSTPLAFVKESVSFTTTVSARFWLMDCRNIADASRMATELYTYMAQVPFMVKFVIFAKRISNIEAKISVFCMTDDKEDKTLEHQEYFTEVAKSRDVEVLEGQDIYLEFIGNLVPVMKSGDQLNMKFSAFRENRLSFVVHVKDQEEPFGRVSFMSEPKCGKGEPPQTPICTLNVSLAGHEIIDNNHRNLTSSSQKSLLLLDSSLNYRDMLNFGYRQAEEIHKADIRLSDICNLLESDWVKLAKELDVPETDIDLIKSEYCDRPSQQAMVMLRLWLRSAGPNATGNSIEQALRNINRNDIVEKCIFNLELVTDDMEKAMAKMQLDQSGFDGLKNELGLSSSRDSSSIQMRTNEEQIIDNGNANLNNDCGIDNDRMATLSASQSPCDRVNDDDNRKVPTEIPFDDSVVNQNDRSQQHPKVDGPLSNQNSENEKYDDDAEINGKQDQETGEILEQYLKNHLTKQIDPFAHEAIKTSDDGGGQCATPPPTPNDAAATATTPSTAFINNEKRNICELIKPASPIAEEKARKIMHEMQEKSRHDEEKHKPGLFIAEEKPIVIKRYPAEEIIPSPENRVEDLSVKCFQVLEQAQQQQQQQQQQLQPDDVLIPKSAEDNSMHDDGGEGGEDDADDDMNSINLLLQNSSTPVGKLKTIKKSSKVVKKSQIPRPKIDAIDWELAQQQQHQEQQPSKQEEKHEQQPETNNIKEISSLVLADVIDDSNNFTNLSHDADVISPGGSDIEDAIVVQTQDMSRRNRDDDDDDDGDGKSNTITTTSDAKYITKSTRTVVNADGSESFVVVTEEHKINDAGVEVIVRETVSQRKSNDGRLQKPQVQTTVLTRDGNQIGGGGGPANISSTTAIAEEILNQYPTLRNVGSVEGTASSSLSSSTTNPTTAPAPAAATTTTITSESPFFNNPSFSKSKTSSTKSLENNITNKTFGSSSDSDIALHEPGIELSEDDVDVVEDHEQTEADFFVQGNLDQSIETINFQMTDRNIDDGGGFETVTTTTTTTRIVTKGGHKLPDYDVSQQEQQQQQLHHSDDYLMHEMLEEVSNFNMKTNENLHLVQQPTTPMVINKVTTQFASEPNTIITTAASATAEAAEELQLDNDQMKALRAEAAAHIDEQLDVALATALSKQHQQQQQQQQQQFASTKNNLMDQFLAEEKSHH